VGDRLRAFFIDADDDRPHLRGGDERRLRRPVVATGRAIALLYMAHFARRGRTLGRSLLAAIGPLSLVELARAEIRGRSRLTTAAEWYPHVGLGVIDVADGALRRRRRPLGPYALIAAATIAAGLSRRRVL
jgi:hypothetical protein